ncbi:T-cell immunomodulatory protein isoform X1 [Thalassophryne amazonica]|uniref:T-cell immunomodulatory protein isoform X1 n=1 Tax=Thalassophryne amazonica TaxID=390379 RepID=UPI001471C858|nr:T-cell immunomodulatory protein isoform X1 [Thalassophryne amazonica]
MPYSSVCLLCGAGKSSRMTFHVNILAFFLLFVGKYTFGLQDVTTVLFGGENYGSVAAFGDFNSDKQTDIFLIRQRSELIILLADLKAPYFKPKVRITKDDLSPDTVITSAVPGDYDGDSQMDVLLTAEIKSKKTAVFIFWGNNNTLDRSEWLKLNKTFTDQPLVMDFNGDMIPDVFGVTKETVTEVCYLKARVEKWQNALSSPVAMRIPHSNAFIDLNMDFTADLFLTIQGSKFETWISKDGNFSRMDIFAAESPGKTIGQSSFVDFDGDGYQDHLLPVCLDDACRRCAIYLAKYGQKQWIPVLSDFKQRDTLWAFVPGKPGQPLTLHLGDYNLDGFPDGLVILRNTNSSDQQAFLLENVPCNSASCHNVGRMFRIHWDQSDLGAIPNAVMATFFDIYEDGILDMLVLSQKEGKDLIIHALKNNFEADAYFVKVMVLSGLCFNDCPEGVKTETDFNPFGVNQPGPYVMYTTVDSNGYLKNASAGQLSQSAHFALHLPYTVLGLGRSANFLDHLYVGIPRLPGETDIRKQEWTAIIPNSQLIVIPYPHNKPRSWSAKLYLTPSNSVLLTAIALIGVCAFILVIIGILHWQEKVGTHSHTHTHTHTQLTLTSMW